MAGQAAPVAGGGNQFGSEFVERRDIDTAGDAARHVGVQGRHHGQPVRRDTGDGTWFAWQGRLNGSRCLNAQIHPHRGRLDREPLRARHRDMELLDLGAKVLDGEGGRFRVPWCNLDQVVLDQDLDARALIVWLRLWLRGRLTAGRLPSIPAEKGTAVDAEPLGALVFSPAMLTGYPHVF